MHNAHAWNLSKLMELSQEWVQTFTLMYILQIQKYFTFKTISAELLTLMTLNHVFSLHDIYIIMFNSV